MEAREQVSLLALPSVPMAGWKAITEDTYKDIASSIPPVTSGMALNYVPVRTCCNNLYQCK